MTKEKLQKLKGIIREKEKTYQQCADAIGISVTAFQMKINGKKRFYIDELNTLGDFLGMSAEEKALVFLLP